MLVSATIEQALASEEKSVVTRDELKVLPSRPGRRSAVRATRKRWGSKAARDLRQLQREQLKLARMITNGEEDLAGQRLRIVTVRDTYETSVEASQTTEQHVINPIKMKQGNQDTDVFFQNAFDDTGCAILNVEKYVPVSWMTTSFEFGY